MPILDYPTGPVMVGGLDLRPGDGNLPDVSLGQIAGAAWRQSNMIGSAANNHLAGIDISEPEDGFTGSDVWGGIKGTKYEPYFESFAPIMNRRAFAAMKAQIDMEEEDRRTLDAGGWLGVGADIVASIMDPTMLLPGGVIVKGGRVGYRALKSAAAVGVSAGAATAVQEVGLQATQTTRPLSESALNVTGATVLGGLLGAGASKLMSAKEAARVAHILDEAGRVDVQASIQPLARELQDIAEGKRSVGAAQVVGDTITDLSVAGRAASRVAETTAGLNPLLRTLTSPSRVVRSVAASLMDNPVYLKKNFDGRGDVAAETAMHEYTRGAVAEAIQLQRNAYSEARKAGLAMTETEFRRAVGMAMRRGDKSDIPAVTQAAKAWRAKVVEPLKERAIKAKLLPEDVSPQTAATYFSRLWSKPMIEANEAEFRQIVRGWLRQEVDRAGLRQQRAADARMENLQRQINDINMRMLRRGSDLEERIARGDVGTDQFSEAEIVEFARRVAAGERPEMPETLSQWLRRQRKDGIYDRNGELAATYPELRNVPGLLRKSRKGTQNQKGGLGLDDIVLRAWEEGFLNDAGTVRMGGGRDTLSERPTIRDFLDALDRDVRGDAVVRVDDMEQAAAVNDFNQVMDALERVGVDLTNPRFATSEAMQDVARAVNRSLDEMDKIRIARLNDEMADAGRRGDLDFVSDADREGYLDQVVDGIFDTVTGRTGDGMPDLNAPMTRVGPLKERTFAIPDEMVEKFLDSDVELVGRRYARLMAADVELSERFGDATLSGPLAEIRDEYATKRAAVEASGKLTPDQKARALADLSKREKADIRDIEGVRDMLRGNYKVEANTSNFARAARVAMAFNYMRALGGVLLSSMSDVVRPAMVHGLSAYMSDGLRPLIANTKAFKMSVAEAKKAGAVVERVLATRMATMAELNDPYSMRSPFEAFVDNAANKFSQLTGLLHWNDFQKSVASVLTQDRILKNAQAAAEKGFDSLPKREKAYMGYLGIGEGRAESLGRLFKEHGETVDGVRVAHSDDWPDDELRRFYRAAINKDVDSIIVTKGAGDVPLLAGTPAGRMLLQFRSFALASNQRVLIRGLQEKPSRFVGGMVAMSAMGMLTYALKQLESGREVSDNPMVWIAEGLDRSGIFSLAFEANNAFEKLGGPGLYAGASASGQALFPDSSGYQPASRFATRTALAGYLGPTYDAAERMTRLGSIGFRAMGGDFGVTEGDINDARRLMPYSTLPYWRWAIDNLVVPELKEGLD